MLSVPLMLDKRGSTVLPKYFTHNTLPTVYTCCVIVLIVEPCLPMMAPTISLSTRIRSGKSVCRCEGEVMPGAPPMRPPMVTPGPAEAPLGPRLRSMSRSTRRTPPSRLYPLSR